MTIVTEAKGALRNGTAAVLSTMQHRQRTIRRLGRVRPQKLMKQMTRHIEARKARRVPVVPIVIASSAALVGAVVGTIVLRRYLAAGETVAQPYPAAEETFSANEHGETLEQVLAER